MKTSHLVPLALLASTLLLLSGCGGEDTQTSSATPPPEYAPAPGAVLPGAPVPAPGAAPAAPAPEYDPAQLARKAKEEDAKIQARIKAGDEGTTPDPVMDPVQDRLDNAYQDYFSAFQKAPSSVEDLVRAGYLRTVPRLPAGKKFKIDPDGAGISIVGN